MRVTLAREYEPENGKKAKADQTVDLPTDEARNLLYMGYARPAEDEKPKTTTTNSEKKEV